MCLEGKKFTYKFGQLPERRKEPDRLNKVELSLNKIPRVSPSSVLGGALPATPLLMIALASILERERQSSNQFLFFPAALD